MNRRSIVPWPTLVGLAVSVVVVALGLSYDGRTRFVPRARGLGLALWSVPVLFAAAVILVLSFWNRGGGRSREERSSVGPPVASGRTEVAASHRRRSRSRLVLLVTTLTAVVLTIPTVAAEEASDAASSGAAADPLTGLFGRAHSDPQDAASWIQLGAALDDAGRYAEAATAYQHASRLRPEADGIAVQAALNQLRAGHPESAAVTLRPVVKRRPHDPEVLLLFAAALRRNHPARARKILTEARELQAGGAAR